MTTERRGREAPLGELHDAKTAMRLMRETLSSLSGAEILVISAYLTVDGLRELLSEVAPTNQVRILARWQSGDLVSGASDLASFELAHAHGWRFFSSQSLHAKAFVLGDQGIFIGSANLTRRGFSVGGVHGNIEILTRVSASAQNIRVLDGMFHDAIEIDQSLVEQLRAWLELQASRTATGAADDIPVWPLLERERTHESQAVIKLTVSECFLTDGGWLRSAHAGQAASAEQEHDISMLAQVELTNRDAVARAIRQTKVFRWLEHQLRETPDHALYFGALTAGLHDALIDDPRPYRRNVKTLLVFLLAWIKAYPECGIYIDRPNHSERVRLVGNI